MVRKTWVQSQIVSYQRLEKWYLIPPCLTVSNIRYVSKVKWSYPGKVVVPSPTVVGIEKKEPSGCLRLQSPTFYIYTYIYIYIYTGGELKVLYYFGNVWYNVAAFNNLLRMWRWQPTKDCEMPNSPDTLQALLARFISLAQAWALESTSLGLPDFASLLRFLPTE